MALVGHLRDVGRPGRIVIGHDTRESSVPICRSLAAGIRAGGGETAVAGVLPTPGVAFLTRSDSFDAGVVISASHNPYHDNGIKLFQAEGTKLPDAEEEKIEARLAQLSMDTDPSAADIASSDALVIDEHLSQHYVAHLLSTIRGRVDLDGVRVVVDCANGAASAIAPRVLAGPGIEATFLSNEPNGTNINRDCGSNHPEALIAAVRANGADLGLAFDGDADRCLAVDETGALLDGDHILYLAALDMRRRGRLRNDTVVATVMSNLWLEQRLGAEKIAMLRTPVGDKYVLEAMVEGDHSLGGEQSGHVIFRDTATTGDGLLTGLMLLACWRDDGGLLSEMIAGIEPCPQVLVNVKVADKPDLAAHAEIGPLLLRQEAALSGRGRLLVRYSGTESLARVMAEGHDAEEIRRIAEEVAGAIREHLS